MIIDGNIKRPWPEEVQQAVGEFRQGDLVEHPPFFYAANPRHGIWSASRDPTDGDVSESLVEIHPDDRPRYGLITTQTCDLVEEDRIPREPWFQVAPVYDASGMDKGRRGLLKRHRIGHLVELTSRSLPEGLWVADLRVEVPLEKSWLVGKKPIPAFEDEQGYLGLAERLAGRRSRPALARVVVNVVINPLRSWLRRMGRQQAEVLQDPVSEVRLAVAGSRLQPDAARLLVLSEITPLSQDVREGWDQWWDSAHEPAEQAGLVLLGNRYETLQSIPALDYLETVALDFAYLSSDD